MQTFFKEIFTYSQFSNQKFIETILANDGALSDKPIYLMSHILNAQLFWNARILKVIPEGAVWETHSPKILQELNLKNHQNSIHIIENFDFETLIEYTNTKGLTFKNTVKDILFHINNHSTHHRGQIASDLRAHNIDPPLSDYIFYKRDNPV